MTDTGTTASATTTTTVTETATTTQPLPAAVSSSSSKGNSMMKKRDKSNPWGCPPSSTTTNGSSSSSSPSTTTTPSLNNNDNEKAVVSLASIMQQQESERYHHHQTVAPKKKSIKKVVQFEETEEEKMIRLAIEASLQDHHGGGHSEQEVTQKGGDKEEEEIMDEDMKLALVLSLQDHLPYEENSKNVATATATSSVVAASSSVAAAAASSNTNPHLTTEEQTSINRALQEAQDEEMAASLRLALQLQQAEHYSETSASYKQEGHVRTVNRSDFLWHRGGDNYSGGIGGGKTTGEDEVEMYEKKEERKLYGKDDIYRHDEYDEDQEEVEEELDEYRVNAQPKSKYATSSTTLSSSSPGNESSTSWTKIDRNTIIGPNNEIRTKHDISLKNKSNAARLLSSSSSSYQNEEVSINDKAYNSFLQKTKKRSIAKGVATHGHGRAENMADAKTKGGAMDGRVRLEITRAINLGLIDVCNGVVKEGKEAIVYHAQGGSYSDGGGSGSSRSHNKDDDDEEGKDEGGERRKYDVAIKVFKRISEFKTRGKYVDGDPRYHGQKFNKENKRDQLELWAEKEYRNLLRANKAGVPVPTPLLQKENILFMRFLGEDGWPSPQLREVDIKHKSKKWTTLYLQIMVAVRRLYHCARLVHGDLSEYNILICPSVLVENSLYCRHRHRRQQRDGHTPSSGNDDGDAHANAAAEDADSLQIVLIDFGQAVERNHPASRELLLRDLSMVRAFFKRQGIRTLTDDEAEEFVMKPFEGDVLDDGNNDDADDEYDTMDGEEDGKHVLNEAAKEEEEKADKIEDVSSNVAVEATTTETSLKTADSKIENSIEAESSQKFKIVQEKEEIRNDQEKDVKNNDDDDDDIPKSTWRHSIRGWNDEKDMEILQDMLRAKKGKKVF